MLQSLSYVKTKLGIAESTPKLLDAAQLSGGRASRVGDNTKPLAREDVIAATITCIEKYGVAKTSMIDVGKVLGVTRQTIHRLFETRADLLTAVAEQRIEWLARKLARQFKNYPSLEHALVEGSLVSLDAGRSDPVLTEIQRRGDHEVDQYMFQGSSLVQQLMISLWGPLIERAKTQGLVRQNLSTESVVEWIRNIHAMLTMREDYGEAEKREMLTKFLVPSIISDAAIARS